jgi:Na+-transporting NADH:ubiquinone oxidoreductase subunit NqrF
MEKSAFIEGAMKIIAIILLVFGLVGLTVGTISFTTKEKVVDIGPIDVTRNKTHSETIPLAASIAALVAGGLLLATSSRRTG